MLYSRYYLEQRIKEEKFRAYRTGSPFSMVLFNPMKLLNENHNGRKPGDEIAEILDHETRETDIKGWWNRNTFAILLPDTFSEAAYNFGNKVLAIVQGNDHTIPTSAGKSNLRVYTFPNNHQDLKSRRNKSDDFGNPKHQDLHSLSGLEAQDLFNCNGLKRQYRFIKRLLDIILSATGLVFLSPVFLVCALVIKLDSRGPVIYTQTRVGKGGKPFSFFKFRTMYHNCDEKIHENHVRNLVNHKAGLSQNGRFSESSYKIVEDERITSFGKVLRNTSLDELPQLFNVLKGDMSLVGPRPHPVYEALLYDQWWRYRLDAKPGITGLGQLDGRYNREYEEVYRLDLRYLKSASLALDLKMLFRTFLVILSSRGAY